MGTVVASDSDAGQTLTYAITGGNDAGAFTIDVLTGQIYVVNGAALDYETSPVFNLTVEVTDNGLPSLAATAAVTIELLDVAESAVGLDSSGNLRVQGTPSDDTIYLWTVPPR